MEGHLTQLDSMLDNGRLLNDPSTIQGSRSNTSPPSPAPVLSGVERFSTIGRWREEARIAAEGPPRRTLGLNEDTSRQDLVRARAAPVREDFRRKGTRAVVVKIATRVPIPRGMPMKQGRVSRLDHDRPGQKGFVLEASWWHRTCRPSARPRWRDPRT
eukprot:scaffold414_cov144-Pinguiococcus_pyrenoidosus.AAC.2